MIFPRIREAKELLIKAVNRISTPEYETTMRVRTPSRDADGVDTNTDARDALVKWDGFTPTEDEPIQYDYRDCRFLIVCTLNISEDDELGLDDHAMVAAADIERGIMAIGLNGTPIRMIHLDDVAVVYEENTYAVVVSFIVTVSHGTDEPYQAQ